MFRSLIKKVFLILVLLFLFIAGVFYTSATRWHSRELAEVNVPAGASLRAIAHLLSEKNVIRAPRFFELYVRMSGQGAKLRAGTYEFPEGTTLLSAAHKLISGDVKEFDLTVVEGWNIKDIANALSGAPYLESKNVPVEFVKLASDATFASSLGLGSLNSLEGYLFPDTYRLTYPVSAKSLIDILVARFKSVWAEVSAKNPLPAGETMNDVVTLASVVEKETGAPEERPLIAGVFKNRLTKKMPLQSDPTIIYGLKNFDGNIRAGDIKNPHPYNTYVHPGLPIGPISNPGKASLLAVLAPKKSDFLYFVSRNDGSHEFTKTLAEHSKAVSTFQLKKK